MGMLRGSGWFAQPQASSVGSRAMRRSQLDNNAYIEHSLVRIEIRFPSHSAMTDMQVTPLMLKDILHHTNKRNNLTSALTSRVCPSENTVGPPIVPFVGTLTYHEFATILSGACGIASALIVGAVIVLHALNYSNPVQQRQIIRVLLLVPWVSLFCFLIVWLSGAGEYLLEALDFGCAIALSAFLLYMCDLVLSQRGGYDELFGAGAEAGGAVRGNSSPKALRITWYGVLQFIPTSVIIWITTAVTLATGVFCKQSNSIHFAHIWIAALKLIVTTLAVLCAVGFYHKHKATLRQHKILLKLFAFKSIIGLNVVQTFIISILSGHNILAPSKYMTYHDINTALAPLLLAVEMPLFALLLAIAFRPSPSQQRGEPVAGRSTALLEALDVRDLLGACVRGPMRLVKDQERAIIGLGKSDRRYEDGAAGEDVALVQQGVGRGW
ncbi:hypothetical protein ACN47E_007324 [Coniothyrium glycines]